MTTEHKGKGHRGRLREKFLSSGLIGFHDYEIIELLLTLATPRKDCKQQAKAGTWYLLCRFYYRETKLPGYETDLFHLHSI